MAEKKDDDKDKGPDTQKGPDTNAPQANKPEEAKPRKLADLRSGPVKAGFAGIRGGAFAIYGSGFGTRAGSLTIGGMPPKEITCWRDNGIRGLLHQDQPSGDVVIQVDGRRGSVGRLD